MRSEEWYEHHRNGEDFKLNFEFKDSKSGKTYASRVLFCDPGAGRAEIDDAALMASIQSDYVRYVQEVKGESPQKNAPIVPVGAGSFWLGVDLLRRIFDEESTT